MIATEAYYHAACLVELYKRAAAAKKQDVSETSSSCEYSLAFAQLVDTLDKLRKNDSRLLRNGLWQHIFTEGLKKSNDKCIFSFARHRVRGGINSRRSDHLFYANAHCSVRECSVTVKMSMTDNSRSR